MATARLIWPNYIRCDHGSAKSKCSECFRCIHEQEHHAPECATVWLRDFQSTIFDQMMLSRREQTLRINLHPSFASKLRPYIEGDGDGDNDGKIFGFLVITTERMKETPGYEVEIING